MSIAKLSRTGHKPTGDQVERLKSLKAVITRTKGLAAASNVPLRAQFLELARDIEQYVKRLETAWRARSGWS